MQEQAGQTVHLPPCGGIRHHETDFFEVNSVGKQRVKIAAPSRADRTPALQLTGYYLRNRQKRFQTDPKDE